MREIKFRYIFTNTDGTLKLFHTTLRQIEEQSLPIGFTNCLINGEEFERVLFTGLKDKNGKDIYEGDILIDGGNKGIVEYFSKIGLFGINLGGNSICNFQEDFLPTDCEVIGNIYENPELLEAKK